MKWAPEAEAAISKVPFFVRKRVRKKVEEEAARHGTGEVRMEHVQACQKKFLSNMEDEVKGHQVETCFGAGGCPNRAVCDEGMAERLEVLLSKKNLRAFLKERVKGPLKMHHEFRASISDCPNSCSRPQIVDVGLIGARKPTVSPEPCVKCGACVEVCREGALQLRDDQEQPTLDPEKCLSCGQCLNACTTGTLQESERGYRILVGGKLGRHPRLGKELKKIYSADEALQALECCLDHYMKHNRSGERFGDVLDRTGIESLESEQ